jgi:hypothetical protein
VAKLFSGWDVKNRASRVPAHALSFSALRLFPLLLERDRATDRWQLIPAYAEKAQALWARAVAEKLSAKAVDEEISKILPARTLPIKRHRPVKLGFLVKLFPRLPLADVPASIARLQEIQQQSLLPAESRSA